MLTIEKKDCVCIGDQPEDIEAGKAAGVATGAALWGFGQREDLVGLRPEYVFKQPGEFLDFLLR